MHKGYGDEIPSIQYVFVKKVQEVPSFLVNSSHSLYHYCDGLINVKFLFGESMKLKKKQTKGKTSIISRNNVPCLIGVTSSTGVKLKCRYIRSISILHIKTNCRIFSNTNGPITILVEDELLVGVSGTASILLKSLSVSDVSIWDVNA